MRELFPFLLICTSKVLAKMPPGSADSVVAFLGAAKEYYDLVMTEHLYEQKWGAYEALAAAHIASGNLNKAREAIRMAEEADIICHGKHGNSSTEFWLNWFGEIGEPLRVPSSTTGSVYIPF